jgi:DNA polymerase-3 subunit delta'
LCYEISRTPFLGGRKAAIINDADFFNEEGANALLKTLEEPPPGAVLILIGTSTAKQLPTIRSRCQIVRLSPLPPDILSSLLVEQKLVSTPLQGEKLSAQAEGSLDTAKEWSDGDTDALRTELMKFLSAARWDAAAIAAKLTEQIDALGKDAPPRRRRLKLLFRFAADHFRNQMRTAESSRVAARHLERTLDALEQVDRNANLPVIIESWAVDLAGN